MPQPRMPKKLSWMVLWRPTRPSRTNTPKDVLLIIGDWNVKVGSQEIPESEVIQSCPTLCNLMDCSLPGSSVHGIFQARTLEWVAISFSRRSSQPRDWTQVSRIVGRHFAVWATWEIWGRDAWSNRQIWPWSTKWSRAKANRVCQENAVVIANTLFQQHKRRLYTWTSPDAQHRNQTDYILCSQRWRSCIQSAKRRPRADCGSDHELLIAKFRLKLRKWGKPLDHSGMT